MKRLAWISLAVGGVIVMVMLLIVWKQGQVNPTATTETTRPPMGNQNQLGTSALSHGGPADPQRVPAPILDYDEQATSDQRAGARRSAQGLDARTVRDKPDVTSSRSPDLHRSGPGE